MMLHVFWFQAFRDDVVLSQAATVVNFPEPPTPLLAVAYPGMQISNPETYLTFPSPSLLPMLLPNPIAMLPRVGKHGVTRITPR